MSFKSTAGLSRLKLLSLKKEPFYESDYIDDNKNVKKVVFFVKEIDKFVPELNNEIDDVLWVTLEKAYELLVFPELKEIIKRIRTNNLN